MNVILLEDYTIFFTKYHRTEILAMCGFAYDDRNFKEFCSKNGGTFPT